VERLETEAPASLTTFNKPALERIPGMNLDDRLRLVPGFTLFRRSSSIVANPTTQGVSLRGLGSTGASRTLVLWDGIPLNDPFGGWVYWTRVAPEQLERVELSRGSSTSLFGDRALGGTLGLFSRQQERRRLRAGYEFGNRNTNLVSGGYADLIDVGGLRMGISGNVRAFTTNGYYIVPEQYRGAVDREAGVRFAGGDARLDFFGARQRLFLKLDMLAEERANGTAAQRNSTSLGNLAAHYSWTGGKDSISVLGYHTRGEYRASFSTIAADRNSERLTTLQTVPSEATGGAAFWRRSASRIEFVLGADTQHVEGESLEVLFPSGKRSAGGSQLQYGFFGQVNVRAGPAGFYFGAREQRSGETNFFTPSAGATVGRGRFRGRGSVYRGFRAPTLNELYREFRAGNAVTQANPALQPETLAGAEAGLDVIGETRRFSVTLFRNSMDDLITNVTLSSSPALIVRQRQNAGGALGQGVEAEVRQRWRAWEAEAAYLYVNSRFDDGRRTPQVPKHGGSAQLSWSRKTTFLTGGLRSTSSQFDDDLNRFLLPGYALLHFTVQQRLWRDLSLVAAMENLLNREFYVGYTPVPSSGTPRMWRIGLRWDGAVP